MRFPRMINDVSDLVNSYFDDEKEKTLKFIETIVEQEINYLCTNDKDYMDNYTEFVLKYQKVVPPSSLQQNTQN